MKRIQVKAGDRYSSLTILREAEVHRVSGREVRRFDCMCDCGSTVTVWLQCLRGGHTKSCGCIRSAAATKHNMCKTSTYFSWGNMLDRCRNRNTPCYDRYGGRGITVCDRWLVFEAFLEDMGERPNGTTIDRWPDNNGNYEPGNCRWASPTEQGRNKRNNRMLMLHGVTLCLSEWAEITGIGERAISHRLAAGWSIEDTLTIQKAKPGPRTKRIAIIAN